MKLRASFFDKTVFRKDITRFAPLWGLYLIGGLMLVPELVNGSSSWSIAYALGSSIGGFSVISLIYALLCGQLLFGDLYNSRLCNALHALPLRREGWFFTHLLSGLCFSVVPNSIIALLVCFSMGELWFVAFIWLLGMTLQFIAFFGIAVFSAFCTGNRFAMAAIYAGLNAVSMIALWLVMALYEPHMFGVSVDTEPYFLLCPVAHLCQQEDMLLWDRHHPFGEQFLGFGDGWGYMAAFAAVGVVLLVLALLLYRQRKLESAGEFLAVKALEPVFDVVYTLCVGAAFALFGELMGYAIMPCMIIGLAVGTLTGKMLLSRTVKVFRWKRLAFFGAVTVAVLLSIGVVKLDPLGTTRWLPETGEVKSVTISSRQNAMQSGGGYFTGETEADIEKVLNIHREILEKPVDPWDGKSEQRQVYFSYTLQSGKKVLRSYSVYLPEETIQQLRFLYSSPGSVLPFESSLQVQRLYISGQPLEQEHWQGLLDAIERDCLAGTMAPEYYLHPEGYDVKLWIYVEYRLSSGLIAGRDLRLYNDAENTVQWLLENEEKWFNSSDYGMDSAQELLKGGW